MQAGLGFTLTLEALDGVSLPSGPFTQVSARERAFLSLLGSHAVAGRGDVVELGAGAGGSTIALCQGLSRNASFTGKVHAFDHFRTGKGTFASPKFLSDSAAADGSFLEDFKRNLGNLLPLVSAHAGDLCDLEPGELGIAGIELLHVDIAKSFRTFACVVDKFFTRLLPGALVLHQDFASPRLPWLHYSTGALLPYVDLILPPIRSTLAFRLLGEVPRPLLARLAQDDFSTGERLELIGAVQERVDHDVTNGIPFRQVLELAKAYVLHYAGQHPEAWQVAEGVVDDPYLARTRQDHFAQLRRALGSG